MSSIQTFEYQVPTSGGNIYVKKWIPETIKRNEVIVLLHDSLGCCDLWRDFPAVLAERFSQEVIAYDRLGFGRSDARVELPSLSFIEEEATHYFPAIKKHLSINQFILVGHSVGGGMAVNIAARDSDCVALVTMAAQAFVEPLTIQGIVEAKEMFMQPGQMDRLSKWHSDKAQWVLDAWTNAWLAEEFADWSLGDVIGQVTCPLLAIHGEGDEYGSSAFPEFIVSRSGGTAHMLLLEGCGHVPHREKTTEVIAAIEALIG